jgi:hypothetical protein
MAKPLHVDVEGIGAFAFAGRTLRDELRINAEIERLTEGQEEVSTGFRNLCYMVAALKVLTVSAPDAWRLLDADALDPETFARIGRVYGGLREAEERFRQGGATQPAGAGTGAGADG